VKKHIVILNGPNLNLVGIRQPEIYGVESFDTFIPYLKEKYFQTVITYHQSNHEGVLIDWLHQYGFTVDGILLNAGGYTHTSIALADAIKSITTSVIEVHLSNIYEREPYRHQSYLKEVCVNTIYGKGMKGYEEAVDYFLNDSNFL
jgi:3-dehydroquinate dehydratase-2